MSRYLNILQFLTIFVICQHVVVARPPLEIMNGTDAKEGEFPYMVEVRYSTIFQCGGSIIGPEWVLTAGHCVPWDGLIDKIVYGTTLSRGYNDSNVIKVKKSYQHPKFRDRNGVPYYDVGLLQLEEPIPFSDKAQPIKIAEANEKDPFHVEGYASGWGGNGSVTTMLHLQKQQLALLTDQECIDKVNNPDFDGFEPIHHLCTDDYFNGICYGDSGGPFVVNGVQYGIISWSYAACYSGPGVYSRITNPEYREWIKNVTNI